MMRDAAARFGAIEGWMANSCPIRGKSSAAASEALLVYATAKAAEYRNPPIGKFHEIDRTRLHLLRARHRLDAGAKVRPTNLASLAKHAEASSQVQP